MKKFIVTISAVCLVVVSMMSCKKKYPSVNEMLPSTERKISFQLYTNQDFSANTSVINFSVFIRKANNILFDSALAPMQIKDIPNAAHKLIVEKAVRDNDNSDLVAGFRYEIENVGHSGFTDTSKAGNPLKVIDFAFQ